MHDTDVDAALIRPLDPADIRRQMRFDPLPLLIAKPKQVPGHDPNPLPKTNQDRIVRAEKLMSSDPRNPRRRGHVPIKCCGVPCAQAAKKPNHKPGYVNSPADTFKHLPSYLSPVFCHRRHEHRFDSTCVNYCFLEQTCAFLDKLSDKRRCDLRFNEYTAYRTCSSTPNICPSLPELCGIAAVIAWRARPGRLQLTMLAYGPSHHGINGVFEFVCVVGRGLVSIAEVHAIVAEAKLAQSE